LAISDIFYGDPSGKRSSGSTSPLLLSIEEELGCVEALIGNGDGNARSGDADIGVSCDLNAINRRQFATTLEVVK
jgi:hypothetical protein